VGRALHAAARVTQGDPGALAEILDGMALAAATGNQSGAPALFSLLAEAQQAAGQLADAQGTVATGLAIAAQTGQLFFDADLRRLDGDLIRATGGAADEAAARYHRAPRHRPRAGRPLVRAARRDEPRAPVARSGPCGRGACAARADLRDVHRGL